MAKSTIVRSCQKGKACHLLVLMSLMVLVQKSDAAEFTVGGVSGWTTPPDPNSNPFNQWAERNRFQVGDSLVFNYQPNQDSVSRVTKENYDSCNNNSPLESFSDGHTSYKFTQSGPHFFISGNKDRCLKNEKIWVVVMADRTNRTTSDQVNTPPPMNSNQTYASPPSPTTTVNQTLAPPPSPTTNQTYGPPPPPPSPTSMAPSPPPTMENPTSPPPAPVSPPSAAPSFGLSFISLFGTMVASSLVLVR